LRVSLVPDLAAVAAGIIAVEIGVHKPKGILFQTFYTYVVPVIMYEVY
jgi:hypothetical protein